MGAAVFSNYLPITGRIDSRAIFFFGLAISLWHKQRSNGTNGS